MIIFLQTYEGVSGCWDYHFMQRVFVDYLHVLDWKRKSEIISFAKITFILLLIGDNSFQKKSETFLVLACYISSLQPSF